MCSALYSNMFGILHCSRASRRAHSISKRVTQSISLSNIHALLFVEKAGPEAVETSQTVSKDWPACFQVEVLKREGFELEAVNETLVELTGIEPVTPCLQSRCSPS